MYVVNRHGEREAVYFDKILNRISMLADGLHSIVDPTKVAQAVINGVRIKIVTSVFYFYRSCIAVFLRRN